MGTLIQALQSVYEQLFSFENEQDYYYFYFFLITGCVFVASLWFLFSFPVISVICFNGVLAPLCIPLFTPL